MRMMMMHKNDPQTEAGELPPPELFQKMGAYIEELARTGRFLTGEGLGKSATRTRLVFRDGRSTVTNGPYQGEKELPAAWALLRVGTREQAIGWAERYGKILGDGEIEVGPVHEPWDFGFVPKPDDAPLRVLLVEKADEDTEAGRPRTPKQKGDLSRLLNEMKKAGVLVSAERLQPSSRGKRLVFQNHAMTILDGPFTESKELIGGFALLELPSLDVAVSEAQRYAAILGGTLEVDIRLLEEG